MKQINYVVISKHGIIKLAGLETTISSFGFNKINTEIMLKLAASIMDRRGSQERTIRTEFPLNKERQSNPLVIYT